MDLYTLDASFQPLDAIDTFESVVWTERYSAAGDVSLVVPATPNMISQLANGVFLGLAGTKEAMFIENQSIDKGLMTVTGKTILNFLNERVVRTIWSQEVRVWNMVDTAGQIMATLVYYMCINGDVSPPVGYLTTAYDDGIERSLNEIPNLSLGDIDVSGPAVAVTVQFAPIYDQIKTIAETAKLGMSIYIDNVNSLKFRVYRGLDRTSGQTDRPMVKFSSALDTLINVKELYSIAGYKTVCYALAPQFPGGYTIHAANKAYVPGAEAYVGFARRVLMIFVEDLTNTNWSGTLAELNAILDQRARDGLANNNYSKLVDGEVVPQSEFKYGIDYGLGDIIELEGQSGLTQNARVTEYIRSQDATGERGYPTLSVV